MAQPDSLVRLRQLNNPDVSGYVVDVLRHYLSTGSVTGIASNTGVLVSVFYPLTSNPSGYVTSGQITGFATRLDVTGNNQNLLTYIDSIYYPRANPSGFMGTGQGDARYLRGSHFQNTTDFQLYDTPNAVAAIDYIVDDIFIIQGINGNSNISKIIFNDVNSPIGRILGFNISGINLTGQTLNGDPIMNSGYVSNHFIPLSKVTAGQAGNGFQYVLLQDAVKSTQFLFEQGANFYMQGRHNVNVSAPYVIDLYGSTGPAYGFASGQPFIRGFYINADKLQKSGVDVLLTSDISASGLATYAQLTGASGILHDVDGTFSTRLVNTGNYILHLITGVTGFTGFTDASSVKITGNQNINGTKTFIGAFQTDIIYDTTSSISIHAAERQLFEANGHEVFDWQGGNIYDTSGFNLSVDWTNRKLSINQSTPPTLDWQNRYLSGNWDIKGALTINGSGVPDFDKVVFTTGDQDIGGDKIFKNAVNIEGVLKPQYIQTYNVLNEGTIYDLASNPSIKWETRKLLDGTGIISIDWASRILSGNWKILTPSGNEVSLNNLVLLTTDQIISGNKFFATSIVVANNGINGPTVLATSSQTTYDSIGQQSIDWNNRLLGSGSIDYALDYGNRILSGNWSISGQSLTTGGPYYPLNNPLGFISSTQTQSITITGKTLSGALTLSGAGSISITTGNSSLIIVSGAPNTGSASLNNVVFITGDQIISGNKTFATSIVVSNGGLGSATILDSNSQRVYDVNGVQSLDWNTRVLGSGSLNYALDYANRILSGIWNSQGLQVSGNNVVTSNQTGAFIDAAHTGSFLTTTTVGGVRNITVTGIFTTGSGISGQILSGNLILTGAGSLTILTGSGNNSIILSGADLSNYVNTTGIQSISGAKTFNDSVTFNQSVSITALSQVTTGILMINILDHAAQASVDVDNRKLGLVGGTTSLDWNNRVLSGSWIAQALAISGVSVTTGGPYYPLNNPAGYLSSTTGVVVTTGDQLLISGFKNFATSLGIGTGASPRGIFDVRSGNANLYIDASGTLFNSGSGRFAQNLSVTNIDITSITHSAASNMLIVPASGQKCSFVISGANAGMITFRKDAPATATSDRVFQFTNAADSAEFFSWDIDANANPLFNLHSKDFIWGKAPAGVFSQTMRLTNAGKLGIGISAPTAFLHLTGGGGANGAALKINSYPVLATPESGAVEFDGTSLFYTDATAIRRTLSTGNAIGGGGVTSLTASGTSISGAITFSGQGVGITSSGQNIIFKNYIQSRAVNTTIDWSSGNSFGNTLTGNTTISFVGQQDGQSITVAMTNSSGNGFSITWPTGTKWPNGTQPVQSSGNPADVTDVYTFLDITGKIYGNVVQKFY